MKGATQKKRGNDRIVSYFMERILSGELTPGVKLPSEGDLCEQFGVSRTVIREAIQQLKALGAIDTINGKGSYIAESRIDHFQDSLLLYSSRAGDASDWLELLKLRSLIETECVRGLARAANQLQIASVSEALKVMRENQNDLGKFAEADIEFHHTIVEAFGNRLFSAVWASLQGLSLRFARDTYQREGQATQNLKEHEVIYQAMLNGQVDAAGKAIAYHLANSRKNLEKMLESTDSYSGYKLLKDEVEDRHNGE